MTAKKSRTLIFRMMLTLLCAAAVAIPLLSVVPASARAATSCTIGTVNGVYEIPYGCGGTIISASHTCQQTGIVVNTTGTATADECADIAVANNSGGAAIWGEGEFYCQGQVTTCQGMNVSVDDKVQNSSGTDYGSPNKNYKCNTSSPLCPNASKAMVATQHFRAKRGTCYFTYSADPADGENGDPQVISTEFTAFHAEKELRSNTIEMCFE